MPGKTNVYHVRTQENYKIWFSKDPEDFLPLENQLRFIRIRQNNPRAKLVFVYSANSLNPKALSKLKKFCEAHHILSFDFDNELDTKSAPLEGQDKTIYQIAQDEINHCRNRTGGSMAAASDCARLLIPIIEKAGNYSDYDVDVKVDKTPDVIEVSAPVILPIGCDEVDGWSFPNFNNNILIFAREDANSSKLHPEAIKHIQILQAKVIKNYSDTASWVKCLFDSNIFGIPNFMEEKIPQELMADINSFIMQNPKATIYEFRKHIEGMSYFTFFHNMNIVTRIRFIGTHLITSMSEEQAKEIYCEKVSREHYIPVGKPYIPTGHLSLYSDFLKVKKHQLLIDSVMSMSGPCIYSILFDPSKVKVIKDWSLKVEPVEAWREYRPKVEQARLDKTQLAKCFRDISKVEVLESEIKIGSDQSWTEGGEKKQQERSQKFLKNASIIFQAWKHHQWRYRDKNHREKRKHEESGIEASPDNRCKKQKIVT
jgi:hypothetical protein